jgi:predicted glycosyltransferase
MNIHSQMKMAANPTDDLRPKYDGTGVGMRILLYSHDTFGLGHLRRCLKISRALKLNYPDLSILLVTGSPQVHRYRIPPGLDYIKLPAVKKTADEKYEPRTPGISFERLLNLRSGLLLETIKEYLPHILIVDHSPLGMKGEMIPALKWIKQKAPNTVTILGMRDILDEPSKIVEQWRSQQIYKFLQDYYDHILIYGGREIFDPVTAYDFPPEIVGKTRFCGYITDLDVARPRSVTPKRAVKNHRQFVVLTIGGGDGAGETVVSTYMQVLGEHRDSIDFDSLIITGPFISNDLWGRLHRSIQGLPVKLRRFVPDTRSFLLRSDLVISTGGYNTTTEILCYAKRALVIPRILYRQEQLIRSQRLHDMGLLTLLHPDEATPERLYQLIRSLLACKNEPLAQARIRKLIQLDGAERLANFCGELLPESKNRGV